MFNVNNDSEELKDHFRTDFHQILAYSSFNGAKQKKVMLIYPSNHFVTRKFNVISRINSYSCETYLVGIPLKKSELPEVKSQLADLISF